MGVFSVEQSFLDALPVGVYGCLAPGGEIVFCNLRAAEIWGRAPEIGTAQEQFCGSYKLWTLEGVPLARAHAPMAQAIRLGTEFKNAEAIVERPDGTRVRCTVHIKVVREAGKIVGAINVFHESAAPLAETAQAILRDASLPISGSAAAGAAN